MSPGYKAHLARVKHTSPLGSKNDLHSLDEDPLLKVSKNDLMKDLSLDNLPLAHLLIKVKKKSKNYTLMINLKISIFLQNNKQGISLRY